MMHNFDSYSQNITRDIIKDWHIQLGKLDIWSFDIFNLDTIKMYSSRESIDINRNYAIWRNIYNNTFWIVIYGDASHGLCDPIVVEKYKWKVKNDNILIIKAKRHSDRYTIIPFYDSTSSLVQVNLSKLK